MADLTQYWQDETNRQNLASTTLQTQASTQAVALQAARLALTNEQNHFLTVSQEIADTRAALAVADAPADATALVAALQADLIELRTSQGLIIDLSEDLARATANLKGTTIAVGRAAVAATAAAAALATATAEKVIRDAAKAAIAAPPLSTLGTAATAAMTGPEQVAAAAQIGMLPPDLVTLCTQQFERQKQRIKDAETAVGEADTALDGEATTAGGVAGAAASAGHAFRAAEKQVLWLSGSGASELARAIGLFTRIAPTPPPPPAPLLSTAEAAAIAATAARTAAATKAAAIVTAAATADAKARAYDSALLAAQAPDPEGDVTATVAAQKTALDGAQGALDTLRTNFVTRADLDGWTVVVPDVAWQRVRDYLEALDILDRLSGLPGTVSGDMDTAEAAYVTALAGAAAADRTRVYIEGVRTARQAVLDQLSAAADQRLLGSVRSDEV